MKALARLLPVSLIAMALASLVACSAAPTSATTRKTTKKKDAGTSAKQVPAEEEEEEEEVADTPVTKPGGSDAGTVMEGGSVGTQDGAAPAKDGGGPVANAPTFSQIYTDYFGPGSLGHCSGAGCHTNSVGGFAAGNTKASCYQGLVNSGQVSGTTSRIASANTCLSWFGQGGTMPTGGGTNSQAAAAVTAWVAAGALNN